MTQISYDLFIALPKGALLWPDCIWPYIGTYTATCGLLLWWLTNGGLIGALDGGEGGSPCRMSIIRNAHVALSILRIDKGSRCVLRCTSILLITYLYCYKVVDYVKEMLVYELSDDIHHNKKCIGNSLK